jgi:predicted amidohydrolase YtcJ
MRPFLIALLLATLASACSTRPKATAPTLLLVNGNFFTADSTRPHATAVAIRADRIVAVGSDAEIRALAGDSTEVIDLQGAFAMPGFIEGHGHFAGLGRSRQNLNFLDTKSYQEVIDMVAARARTTPAGQWIEGRGWHQEKWNPASGAAEAGSRPSMPAMPTVNGYPYHTTLSDSTPNHPVVLFHASGHALLANARAMELAGISRETRDPAGGRIVRDAGGMPIGVFEENAMDLLERPLQAWKDKRPEAERRAEFERTAALAAEACRQHGITSFQDAGSSFWELAEYRRVAENGQLGVRLWAMASAPRGRDTAGLDGYPQVGLAHGFFTCRAVKAYLDGALGSYGAWLLAPYADKPDSHGQTVTPPDTVAALAGLCARRGLQLCVHAIGDRANREVLNLYERAQVRGARWRIEHSQHVDPADHPRFAGLGVIASIQAIHCTSDAPFVVKRLGLERARTGAYAWRSLLDHGARLANGTDAPVEAVDPLACLYAAVTRKRADTQLEFFPEQKMMREEALLSYTLWNAFAAFEEQDKGSLTPGKYADIVVLSDDLLHCAPERLLQATVVKTVLAGRVVFER